MQVGWSGYLNTNEKYFYCLDALPIFTAFCVYSLLHFGRYLQAHSALTSGAAKVSEVIVETDGSSRSRPSTATPSKLDRVKSALTFGRVKKSQTTPSSYRTFSELSPV